MLKKQKEDVHFDPKITQNLRIAVARTDYYKELIYNLEHYAVSTLVEHGVPLAQIEVFTAPGSWELPLLAQKAAESKKFDAIIALGIIIKGDTYHFTMIANECARALMQVSLDYSIPVALEVLAVENLKQAEIRAGKNDNNKGIEGALAVLKTLNALKNIA